MTGDRCCFICRTPFGCAAPNCEHHIEARRTADADDKARKLYNNPTQDKAIANVMREQQKNRRTKHGPH